ncbi:MAG TPA: SDR family oxidoreductase [Candidatus Acidoferrales bacterium]
METSPRSNSTNDRSPIAAGLDSCPYTYWRVEGSLLNLTAVRPVGFFAWNAQSFLERWARRGTMGVLAVARPIFYATHRVGATRLLHTVLRGVSRDRLELLGQEYFEYVFKPRLKPAGVAKLNEAIAGGERIVLVSQGLDHIMGPLAEYLGVESLIANRLEFRDGMATGRLLDPVIRPRGPLAKLIGHRPDGRISREKLAEDLGYAENPENLERAIRPARREPAKVEAAVVHFPGQPGIARLSVRESLAGKNILLIGATGFIGKVWIANLLHDLPEIRKVYVLIRRNRSQTSLARFQKIVEESPVFGPLAEQRGARLAEFLRDRVQVVEGDVTKPGLGLSPEIAAELAAKLDVIVNSSGLTDFNPDLRDALSSNVHAVANVLNFLATCRHGSLLHLSTCYVAGKRDGRILEEIKPNYTPVGAKDYDAEKEMRALEGLIRETEARAESPEVTAELRRQALASEHAAKDLHGVALDNQVRKNRTRWIRQQMTAAGTRRANEFGWPNTYTLTKGLAESLIQKFMAASPQIPIALVRPAIVESSIEKPFLGWNEGINTSASLSYLLGTYFRQLPTNERKCLDIVPVDLVCRGMTLVAAALVQKCHAPVYQIASSVTNPCNMRRSIELTGLGHRKYYRAQNGLGHRMKIKFDAIPVSKARYEKLSAPAQKAFVQAINRSVAPIPFVKPPLARQERELDKVIKLIALFEPFILHNDHIFEASNIERLAVALPEEERADFGYDAGSLDWWDYWINVHIPALRKWCYPLIEGRAPEAQPRRNVPLGDTPETGAGAAEATRAAPATS